MEDLIRGLEDILEHAKRGEKILFYRNDRHVIEPMMKIFEYVLSLDALKDDPYHKVEIKSKKGLFFEHNDCIRGSIELIREYFTSETAPGTSEQFLVFIPQIIAFAKTPADETRDNIVNKLFAMLQNCIRISERLPPGVTRRADHSFSSVRKAQIIAGLPKFRFINPFLYSAIFYYDSLREQLAECTGEPSFDTSAARLLDTKIPGIAAYLGVYAVFHKITGAKDLNFDRFDALLSHVPFSMRKDNIKPTYKTIAGETVRKFMDTVLANRIRNPEQFGGYQDPLVVIYRIVSNHLPVALEYLNVSNKQVAFIMETFRDIYEYFPYTPQRDMAIEFAKKLLAISVLMPLSGSSSTKFREYVPGWDTPTIFRNLGVSCIGSAGWVIFAQVGENPNVDPPINRMIAIAYILYYNKTTGKAGGPLDFFFREYAKDPVLAEKLITFQVCSMLGHKLDAVVPYDTMYERQPIFDFDIPQPPEYINFHTAANEVLAIKDYLTRYSREDTTSMKLNDFANRIPKLVFDVINKFIPPTPRLHAARLYDKGNILRTGLQMVQDLLTYWFEEYGHFNQTTPKLLQYIIGPAAEFASIKDVQNASIPSKKIRHVVGTMLCHLFMLKLQIPKGSSEPARPRPLGLIMVSIYSSNSQESMKVNYTRLVGKTTQLALLLDSLKLDSTLIELQRIEIPDTNDENFISKMKGIFKEISDVVARISMMQ